MPKLREKNQQRRAWVWGSPWPGQESDLVSWSGVGCSPWTGEKPAGLPRPDQFTVRWPKPAADCPLGADEIPQEAVLRGKVGSMLLK